MKCFAIVTADSPYVELQGPGLGVGGKAERANRKLEARPHTKDSDRNPSLLIAGKSPIYFHHLLCTFQDAIELFGLACPHNSMIWRVNINSPHLK